MGIERRGTHRSGRCSDLSPCVAATVLPAVTAPRVSETLAIMTQQTDPLLSVEEIARLWKVDTDIVSELVEDRSLPTLDGGAAVKRGRLDVPCARLTWAEALRVDSPGAVRRIDDPHSGYMHAAAYVAMQLHRALADEDIGRVWDLSSQESRAEGESPEGLWARWRAALPDGFGDDVAITSGVYELLPHRGVGVRLVHSLTTVPISVDKATPIRSAGLIPMIEEDGAWYAHLPLAELGVEWFSLLRTAPAQASEPGSN